MESDPNSPDIPLSNPPGVPLPGSPGALLPDLGLLGIDHIGVAVADLEAAVEFYRRVFGMPCVHVEENHDQGVREAMLAVGAGRSRVQLLAPLGPKSPIAKFLDRSGPGIQHVAYAVADVEVAGAALRTRGIRLLYEHPRPGTSGSLINFAHPKDTGGVLVEVVQAADRTA